MEKNRLSLMTLFAFFSITYLLSTNVLRGQKSVMILFKTERFEEPELGIIRIIDSSDLKILPVIFPEDLLQFIECCTQDTIQFIPVDTYLQRTSLLTTEERLGEESFYIKSMKQLKKKKKKMFRMFSRQRDKIFGLNLYISTCECVINDPWASINRLVLIKSISRVSKRGAGE